MKRLFIVFKDDPTDVSQLITYLIGRVPNEDFIERIYCSDDNDLETYAKVLSVINQCIADDYRNGLVIYAGQEIGNMPNLPCSVLYIGPIKESIDMIFGNIAKGHMDANDFIVGGILRLLTMDAAENMSFPILKTQENPVAIPGR